MDINIKASYPEVSHHSQRNQEASRKITDKLVSWYLSFYLGYQRISGLEHSDNYKPSALATRQS